MPAEGRHPPPEATLAFSDHRPGAVANFTRAGRVTSRVFRPRAISLIALESPFHGASRATAQKGRLHGTRPAIGPLAEKRHLKTPTEPNPPNLHMTKKSIPMFCAIAAATLAMPSLSWAAPKSSGKEVIDPKKNVIEQVKESCITGDIGVNVVSQYISRGVVLENQGVIVQPFADLYFKLYEGEGFLNKVSLNLGIWSSIHEEKTDAGAFTGTPGVSSTRNWYEFDWTAGLSFTFAKNWTLTPSIYSFLSPNDGFATFYGLNTKLAYDDSALWGDSGFKLSPYVQVLVELENKAGSGADEGVYYEVGIAPSIPVGPVTVTLPVTAGFGSNDFYGSLNEKSGEIEDEWFGFVSAGANLSYSLSFVPECYGSWTVSAGYTYYFLGEGTRDFNTPQRGGAVRGEEAKEHEHVFSAGLVVAF
jgi:hypothetical protein